MLPDFKWHRSVDTKALIRGVLGKKRLPHLPARARRVSCLPLGDERQHPALGFRLVGRAGAALELPLIELEPQIH